jgi:hypothetical protein
MIRNLQPKDELNFITYYSSKVNCSLKDAKHQFKQIIKSGLPALIKDESTLSGVCWIDSRKVEDKKIRYLNFLVNNWRLAEAFLQVLRWNYNGEVIVELDKHHFLNRTVNKNRFIFLRTENNKNIFKYTFIKREIYGKLEESNEG